MHAPHNRPSRRVVQFVAALIVAGGLATAIHAGAPPNLLDDNRGNLALEATETAAFNLAISTAGFFADLLQAQSGKGVDPTAAAIMIVDAEFLITHCP
jgi:hypothetical protein